MKTSTLVSVTCLAFAAVMLIGQIIGLTTGTGFLIASVIFALAGGGVFITAFIIHKIRAARMLNDIALFLNSSDTEANQ